MQRVNSVTEPKTRRECIETIGDPDVTEYDRQVHIRCAVNQESAIA